MNLSIKELRTENSTPLPFPSNIPGLPRMSHQMDLDMQEIHQGNVCKGKWGEAKRSWESCQAMVHVWPWMKEREGRKLGGSILDRSTVLKKSSARPVGSRQAKVNWNPSASLRWGQASQNCPSQCLNSAMMLRWDGIWESWDSSGCSCHVTCSTGALPFQTSYFSHFPSAHPFKPIVRRSRGCFYLWGGLCSRQSLGNSLKQGEETGRSHLTLCRQKELVWLL